MYKRQLLARPAGLADFVVDGDQKLRAIEKQIRHINVEKNPEKVAQLYSELDDAGGYQAEARAGEILNGLGFVGKEFNKPHAEFSGGWRIRLNLGRTLMAKSDLLLLDEPTNHLDLPAIGWLEESLAQWPADIAALTAALEEVRDLIKDTSDFSTNQRAAILDSLSSFETNRKLVGKIGTSSRNFEWPA